MRGCSRVLWVSSRRASLELVRCIPMLACLWFKALTKSCVGTKGKLTERRDDDNLGTLCDEFAEGFREGKIPADEDTDASNRSVKNLVDVTARGGEMLPLGTPVNGEHQSVALKMGPAHHKFFLTYLPMMSPS